MYKRIFRQASEEARTKMSAAHQGIVKSDLTKQRISQGLKKYWETVPSKEEYTTMNQLLGIRDEKRGASTRQPQRKNN